MKRVAPNQTVKIKGKIVNMVFMVERKYLRRTRTDDC